MIVWTVRIDRRQADFDAVQAELRELGESVRGLEVELVGRDAFEAASDAGAFRDFVAVGTLRHEAVEVLEYVGEELVDAFGWHVDFAK